MKKRYLALTVLILIIAAVVFVYLFGDRSQFYSLYFLTAGADCDLQCVSMFKSWCAGCRSSNWPDNITLTAESVECMKLCAPRNMPFPDSGNCEGVRYLCEQYFPS